MKTIVVLGAAAVGLMWFASKRRAQAQAQAALPAGTTTAQATTPSYVQRDTARLTRVWGPSSWARPLLVTHTT